MIRRLKTVARSTEGAASVEFIVIAPFLILMLVGIMQLGIIGFAKAGLQQAVEAGARYATLYPRPTDSQISAKILASGYGMQSSGITNPTFTHGTVSATTSTGGTTTTPYVDITMSYSLTPNFIFFATSPLTLSYTRRAFQN